MLFIYNNHKHELARNTKSYILTLHKIDKINSNKDNLNKCILNKSLIFLHKLPKILQLSLNDIICMVHYDK